MNDMELDEMLNTWTAPQTPASLRDSMRTGFAAAQERSIRARPLRGGKLLVTGAVLGAAALVLVIAQAHPGSSPARIPYTVDSEFIRYANDGSSSIDMYGTSYNHNGREIMLSSWIPGHPFVSAIRRSLNGIGLILFDLSVSFRANAEREERAATAARVKRGCVDGPVVGRDTLLNHPATAVQHPTLNGWRTTMWMAPDLGCFALRITTEDQRPDGTYRLVTEKRALKVNLNP